MLLANVTRQQVVTEKCQLGKGLSPAKCTSEALFLGSFIVLMHWFIKRSPASVDSVVVVGLVTD